MGSLGVVLAASAAVSSALTALPPGLDDYTRASARGGALSAIRRSASAAIGRALAAGVEHLEVEFPPLIETKGQFDDFSNVEVLDANRDFAMQLALESEIVANAAADKLWLVFADDGEVELAEEAWPGQLYAAATITSIAAAVSGVGETPLKPFGAWAVRSKAEAAAVKAKSAPAASLHLCVQPGDGGPMEDWLNLELLKRDETPLICLNGALDKVTSGYYSNFLNPKLGECAGRFYSKFEQVYYCKPIGSGRGWLFRSFPEEWQLHRQTKEGLELVETYAERPTAASCVERLKRA
jgi:hypothetical protein